MNHNQIAKNNMFKKLLTFFAVPANAAIWSAFTRLVTEIATFVSLNGELDDATQTQAQVTTGITQGKSDAFNDMIKVTVEMAMKAFVWAVDNNNDELIHVFDVQLSDFDNIAEQTAFDKVKNIRDGINTNIAGMAGVELLPADVTALDGLISAYELVRQAPEVAIGHKETSTDAIVDLFHDIDSSLGIISRLIISHYSSTNSGMVSDFKNNKHIDDLPTHHSGIHTHITDAATGTDIQGAILSIPLAGKSSTSDINGITEIIKIKNGDYHVSAASQGYKTQTFKIKILRGKILSYEIKLTVGSGGGGGGVTAVREGDVPYPGVVNIPFDDIHGTPQTTILFEITGSAMRFYASATPGGGIGDDYYEAGIGQAPFNADAFADAIGLSPTKPFLSVVCVTAPGHFKLTFDHLEA